MSFFAFHRQLFVGLFALSIAVPALSQQQKGDSELGLNGSLSFSNPAGTGESLNGNVNMDYGFYFTRTDLLGFQDSVDLNSTPMPATPNYSITGKLVSTTPAYTEIDATDVISFRYRHLFPLKNPRVFPFVEGDAGEQITGNNAAGTTTTSLFLGSGIAGMKFFVSQQTAFEVAYNYEYISGTNGGASSSLNLITFGFTFDFGSSHRKH